MAGGSTAERDDSVIVDLAGNSKERSRSLGVNSNHMNVALQREAFAALADPQPVRNFQNSLQPGAWAEGFRGKTVKAFAADVLSLRLNNSALAGVPQRNSTS